jgi:aryl-alcohol dehydrogenase-like predicted oxidoreductase
MSKLGKSDIEVNPIGMGCWAYGGGEYWGEQSQNEVDNIVRKALDMGLNLFDTAEAYNNGASEESLGKALKGVRHKAVVCSKVSPSNARPEALRRHCEASLKRLGMDYLDIYMLHWPINHNAVKHYTDDMDILSNLPDVRDAFETFTALQKEGKIRHIGVSNFGVKQMAEAKATGANIILNEIAYNIFSRAIEKDIVPYCLDNEIAIIGSMALQQGLLAGIYATAGDVPHHQAHSRHFRQDRGLGTSRHNGNGAEKEIFEAIGQLKDIASELNVHIAQMAIAWVLAKPGIKCTLAGSRNISELEANVKAGLLNLGSEIIGRIDSISEPVLKKLGYNPDYYESEENSRIE